jgi:hypothetical protein
VGVDRSIGLAVDGTGKKVRNLEVTVLEYDPVSGTTAPVTMEMQVVSIADKTGRKIGLDSTESLLQAILDKLEDIRFESNLRGGN